MRERSLSREEEIRYGRHLVMPEVSEAGQKRIKAARVLCVGLGGLGSPLSLYLAAAGVGRLGLADFDAIDLSNIQRQILYGTEDVGHPKTEVAARRLQAINPHVDLITHHDRLTSENTLKIFEGYDIVADGTDNFATRYLINDACVLQGKPNVHASIFRFEGQISVFDARRGPCYRCIFPQPPPPGLVPTCAEAGVLGALPGILGSMQAIEVLKLILGQGESLVGRLLLIDTLAFIFREVRIQRDPRCAVCGDTPNIRELRDEDAVCRHEDSPADDRSLRIPGVTPEQLQSRILKGESIRLLDVREPFEERIAKIGDSLLVPLGELSGRAHELDPSREYVVYCHTGIRSAYAVGILRDAGFQKVFNLNGGIERWSLTVDGTVPRY